MCVERESLFKAEGNFIHDYERRIREYIEKYT